MTNTIYSTIYLRYYKMLYPMEKDYAKMHQYQSFQPVGVGM